MKRQIINPNESNNAQNRIEEKSSSMSLKAKKSKIVNIRVTSEEKLNGELFAPCLWHQLLWTS